MIDFLTSSSFGAVVGVVGSWLTKREERETERLKLDHAKEEMRIELEFADKKLQQTIVEGDIAISKGEISAFQESLTASGKSTGVKFVDGVRGLMRPVITIYLLVVASYVVYQINAYVGGITALPEEELVDMFRSVVSELLFLLTTAITWWFGSRPTKR